MIIFLIIIFIFLFSFPTYADIESWSFIETKPKMNENINLRIFSGYIANTRSKGIGNVLLRLGPIFKINNSSNIAIHFLGMAIRNKDGNFIQEIRGELENVNTFNLFDFNILNRNRLEYRTYPDLNQINLLLRNMVRFNYSIDNKNIPFISEESFFDIFRGKLNQNRLIFGNNFELNQNLKIDIGCMLRHRLENNQWIIDYALFTVLFVK
jgi:hypothetical protein